MNTKTAVVEFLKEERNWISRDILVRELHSLGQHSGGVWPRLSVEAIEDAVDELIGKGEIVQSPYGMRWRDVLFTTPAVVQRKPTKRKQQAEEATNGQGMLF